MLSSPTTSVRSRWWQSSFVSDYGSVAILLLLCLYYSWATLSEQHPITTSAGRKLADSILREHGENANVLIVVRTTSQDEAFSEAVASRLKQRTNGEVFTERGTPVSVRKRLKALAESGTPLAAIATHQPSSIWGPLQPDALRKLGEEYPLLHGVKVSVPKSYVWPSFLTRENLLNVINQNADIAIIAIGMTLVIISAGIDLSVGSLLALSGVTTAIAIEQWGGGEDAGIVSLLFCSLVGLLLCGGCGVANGLMVTWLRVPAFVVTLGMMMVARGLALIVAVQYQKMLSGGTTEGTPEAISIHAESFGWLGNGMTLGIPNPIILMLTLYVLTHLLMSRTSLGRYIYAVGGNPEAARLSGVPVYGVLIFVYALCGVMAGLGGIVDASRFEGGRPNAGEMYELQVIAAVVVGGTSLAGGEGKVFGTLIGAMIIAVIQNG
ncbi:MAG: ABC transporter permease, partial [Planctomycetaceae bacterium]|nr:ABC transporter permease [Planctomycetaceae bacterium]